jgi:hypothetical protein
MEQSDITGSVADPAPPFDQAAPPVRAPASAAAKATPKKATPKAGPKKAKAPGKPAPRKATVAAAEVTTQPANAPAPDPPATRPSTKAAAARPAKPTNEPTAKRGSNKAAKPAARTDGITAATTTPKPTKTRSETTETRSADAEPTTDAMMPAVTEHESTTPTQVTRPLWAAIAAEPRRAVDHAALAAVRELGPSAQRWLDQTRQRYPTADPDALARLAAYEYRAVGGRRTATVAGATLVGPFAVTGTLMRTQVEVVLAIAGAYGLDPTHPDRAGDLKSVLHARSPKHAARGVVGLAVRVLAERIAPFGGAVAALAQHRRTTTDVAERARGYFRGYRPGI